MSSRIKLTTRLHDCSHRKTTESRETETVRLRKLGRENTPRAEIRWTLIRKWIDPEKPARVLKTDGSPAVSSLQGLRLGVNGKKPRQDARPPTPFKLYCSGLISVEKPSPRSAQLELVLPLMWKLPDDLSTPK